MAVECGWSYLPVSLLLQARTVNKDAHCLTGQKTGPGLMAQHNVALHRWFDATLIKQIICPQGILYQRDRKSGSRAADAQTQEELVV